jgi:hypothetical protein
MTTHGQSSESRWAQIQRDLGHRLSKRLFDELSTDPHSIHERRSNGFPRFSLSIAYVMAVLVYGLSLMFGLLGLALIMPPWNTIFDPMLAAVFMLLCWAARPRIVAPPYYMLSRTEFPTLYALSDRIANVLRTRPVRGIAYSADFGANYREAGFANRPYIELGAPLLAILENDQRLAVRCAGANRLQVRRQVRRRLSNTSLLRQVGRQCLAREPACCRAPVSVLGGAHRVS